MSEYLFERLSTYSFYDAARFTREIPELDEDVFFFFRIEHSAIDIFEEGEFFIESFSIIFLEIATQYQLSFFYKKTSLFTIDKLPDVVSCFRGFYYREPNRIWFFMWIGRNLYTLTITEYIVERDDMSVYLGYSELISEL